MDLRDLLEAQRVASLGTLNKGEPHVSMVPFAILPGGSGFVIHVSGLAAHTKNMLAHPAVSLMVMAPQSAEVEPQALARVTIQGDAARCSEALPGHAQARQSYLARFPESAPMFELGDFALFVITPRSVRFVAGFAQARSMTPEGLAKLFGDAA